MALHIVRYGLMGSVEPFRSEGAAVYPRGSRVVVRTRRGLEVGEVLASAIETDCPDAAGEIARRMSAEDERQEARLQRRRDEAYRDCSRLLEEINDPAVLMDVEPMFDGRGLYFYFLGDAPAGADRIGLRLSERFEADVEFHPFGTATSGCCGSGGCGCGSGEADATGRGGCTSCASCPVVDLCKKKEKATA